MSKLDWYSEVDKRQAEQDAPKPKKETEFQLSERSLKNLNGVHKSLVTLACRAIKITEVDFVVTEGLRTRERQAELVRNGASQTMRSRHLVGAAIDVAPVVDGKVRWDWALFFPIAEAFKKAAEELDLNVEWGGTWRPLSELEVPVTAEMLHTRFPDGPHFQLPYKEYPLGQ